MKHKILLLTIILAAILRFYRLDSVPALNADEAAIGYNAYSLLQTGKDEHGNPWPIHFQSFNDWKPGMYFYISMPFVAVLGLNEMAVRFPSALLGVATVYLVWLLTKELFPRQKWLPELAALFLAISPWNLHYSRGGWEANAATFFIAAGLFCFIKGFSNSKFWYFSIMSFVASLYTYHSARIVVPLMVAGLALVYKNKIWDNSKKVVRPVALGLILLLPLAISLVGPAGFSRAAGVGLFADTGPYWRINQQRGEHEDLDSLVAKLFHNKPVNYSFQFLENYTSHFWGEFLFLSGDDIQRDKVPETGVLYLFDLIFIPIGLLLISRNLKNWSAIILWLLVVPVAAALTFQSPHTLRSQNMAVPFVIISAFGVISLLEWLRITIKKKNIQNACYLIIAVFVFWSFTRYIHEYYVHMSKTYDYSSQYGVKQLVSYVNNNQEKYSKVVVTDRYDQPYVLFLFYSKYSPSKFQNDHTLTPKDQFGFSTVRKFDKFEFRTIDPWNQIRQEYPGALIAGTEKEIPEGTNVLETIVFPSGRTAFKIVAN